MVPLQMLVKLSATAGTNLLLKMSEYCWIKLAPHAVHVASVKGRETVHIRGKRGSWRGKGSLWSLLLLVSLANSQNLPDAPHPSRRLFWAGHAGLLAATIYDEELTHAGLAKHKCVEGNPDLSYHPTRGQLYAEGLGIDAGITLFDYLLLRKLAHGTQFTGAAIGIAKHIDGGSRWFIDGCF